MTKFTTEQLKQIRTKYDLIQVGAITINTYQDNIDRIKQTNPVPELRKVYIKKDVCNLDSSICPIKPSIRWCISYVDNPTINRQPLLQWWVPSKEQAIELCAMFNMNIAYIVDEEVPTIKSILSNGKSTCTFDSLINLNLKTLNTSTKQKLISDLTTILKIINDG